MKTKKKIITTHIDTGGHGYLSMSKADFLRIGGDPAKVTGFSGHNLTRIYLEEDCDQNYIFDMAEANGFEIERKSGYNLHFKITHNFKPELFNYVPEIGQIITLSDDRKYEITTVDKRGIFVRDLVTKMIYKINRTNPFDHIKAMQSEPQTV